MLQMTLGRLGTTLSLKTCTFWEVCGNACCIHDLLGGWPERWPWEPHLRKFPQATGSLPSPMCFRTLLHLSCLLRHLKAHHMPLCKSNWSTGTQVILEIYQLTASLRGLLCSSKQPSLLWELCLQTAWFQVFQAYLYNLGNFPLNWNVTLLI